MIYDPERAEAVCSKCGLVIDDAKPEFLTEFNAVPRRKPRSIRTPKAFRHPSKPLLLKRGLQDAFSKRNVPKTVRDKAFELCGVVRKHRFHTGYPISTLSSALLYASYRLCRVPVTLNDCTTESARERKAIARCYDRLCRRLELSVPRFESMDYLSLLADRKRIDSDTVATAGKILLKVKERHLFRGATPIGVAAAALYLACMATRTNVTQKELAYAAMVSEVTIRANCNALNRLSQTQQLHEQRV